jgi:hypothetical protein
MYKNSLKATILRNISNIPGWRTNRHIVVIESDDWGSVRMSSLDSFKELLRRGVPVDTDHYNINDSLESNDDLEILFDTLRQFNDKSGRPPVMTGVNVVANPNFDKIRQSEFTEYIYEPYTETCLRYDNHDKVYELWKKGISERLFMPIFHGREHLNAQFWMRALKNGSPSTLAAFNCGVTGIPRIGINGENVPNFQAAFLIESVDDLPYQKEVIETGLKLFEALYGYKASYFVPTNGWFNNSLEAELYNWGIKYINTAKKQKEPLGNGQFNINTRYIGDCNKFGQIYLTRNCFFEPSATGFEVPNNYNWVDNCLHEIEIAFRWHKPATISSHRVNYIGYLNPENRERSHKLFKELLSRMLKRWPDIEFMTSMELGDLITSSTK